MIILILVKVKSEINLIVVSENTIIDTPIKKVTILIL